MRCLVYLGFVAVDCCDAVRLEMSSWWTCVLFILVLSASISCFFSKDVVAVMESGESIRCWIPMERGWTAACLSALLQ